MSESYAFLKYETDDNWAPTTTYAWDGCSDIKWDFVSSDEKWKLEVSRNDLREHNLKLFAVTNGNVIFANGEARLHNLLDIGIGGGTEMMEVEFLTVEQNVSINTKGYITAYLDHPIPIKRKTGTPVITDFTEAILCICGIEASDMKNVEALRYVGDENDPYAAVSFSHNEWEGAPKDKKNENWLPHTATQWERGSHAEWKSLEEDKRWRIRVTKEELQNEKLKISLYDENKTIPDVKIGSAVLSLVPLLSKGVNGGTIELSQCLDHHGTKTGRVTIIMKLLETPHEVKNSTQKIFERARLCIDSITLTGLKSANSMDKLTSAIDVNNVLQKFPGLPFKPHNSSLELSSLLPPSLPFSSKTSRDAPAHTSTSTSSEEILTTEKKDHQHAVELARWAKKSVTDDNRNRCLVIASMAVGTYSIISVMRRCLICVFTFSSDKQSLQMKLGWTAWSSSLQTMLICGAFYLFAHRILGYVVSTYLRSWLLSVMGNEAGSYDVHIGWTSVRGLFDLHEIVLRDCVWRNHPAFKKTPFFLRIEEITVTVDFMTLYRTICKNEVLDIDRILISNAEVFIERADPGGDPRHPLNLWGAIGVKESPVKQSLADVWNSAIDLLRAAIDPLYSGVKKSWLHLENLAMGKDSVEDMLTGLGEGQDSLVPADDDMMLNVQKVIILDVRIHPSDFLSSSHMEISHATDIRLEQCVLNHKELTRQIHAHERRKPVNIAGLLQLVQRKALSALLTENKAHIAKMLTATSVNNISNKLSSLFYK